MSRLAAKSSADKNNALPSAQVTPPPMQELDYIIPGRLTRAQWMDMLIHEEADEIVGEMMDEVLSRVMEGCLNVYVETQTVPFTVSWARSYITQILEQQIICPDVGDEAEEASKMEDLEPSPAIPDSWAQECVPVVTTPPLQQEAGSVHISVQKEPVVNQPCRAVARANSSPKHPAKETSTGRSVSDKYCKVLSPLPPRKTVQKKKLQVNVMPKPVPGKLLPSLSTSEKKDLDLENKRRALSYQPKPIPKIDPATLPRHCVVPQYEIVDNSGQKLKKPGGLSKLQPKYNKKQTEWTATSPKPLTSTKDQLAGFQRRHATDVFLKKSSPSTQRRESIASSGSLRLDKMVLAKGVSLLDPKEAEMNPVIFNSIDQSTNLRPIRSDVAVPLISADQITTGPPPKIIPLFESRY
ncbi:hypothetical protein Q5P01_014612 [Channa striata]|uniref:Uncharacterized protein n=1 Tax=Channa striata TaxID=64152 RepID=A0AA88MFR0_CHASR|nr:hypothetical protein Q5P01_014612 [Channa striata]